ncbi:MAG TPA: hypothetical protein PK048_00210 [Candidatus Absconditabacterales bacterium]|nr:hypothetical protein [Candidatus Absconditabacterales bacterium]
MLKSLFNALKWSAIGVAMGQLISGYQKDKTFKSKLHKAQGWNKLKEAWSYLVTHNKHLIENTNIDTLLEEIKTTASQAQKQLNQEVDKVKNMNTDELITTVKTNTTKVINTGKAIKDKVITKAGQTRDEAMILFHKKYDHIETELQDFESKALTYGEESWTEYYRQIASKFALRKKSATKYLTDGVLAAEEQFDLEQKIKYLSHKLEELKTEKKM